MLSVFDEVHIALLMVPNLTPEECESLLESVPDEVKENASKEVIERIGGWEKFVSRFDRAHAFVEHCRSGNDDSSARVLFLISIMARARGYDLVADTDEEDGVPDTFNLAL